MSWPKIALIGGAVSLMVTGVSSAGSLLEEKRSLKPTLNQLLGYGPSEKLLILQIDDIGSFHSANRASRDLLRSGVVRSGSVMMAGPEVDDARPIMNDFPDLGVHVTLTSDFSSKPCVPVAGAEAVPSLVDWTGAFSGDLFRLVFSSAREVDYEIEEQVKKSLSFGLKPTHLDTHVGTVFFRPAWLKSYLNIARKYQIPPVVPRWSEGTRRLLGFWGRVLSVVVNPLLERVEAAGFLLIDDFYILPPPPEPVSYEARREEYIKILRGLKPGVSQIAFHPAYADGDFQRDVLSMKPNEIFRSHEARILEDPVFLHVIESEGIRLIGWREIANVYPWQNVRDF